MRINRAALFIFFAFLPGLAVAETQPTPHKILRVGVDGAPPFVVESNGVLTGIVIDVWEKIAAANQYNFRYVPFTSMIDASAALRDRRIDILLGPIAVTSQRITDFVFSQPYFFDEDLALAVHVKPRSLRLLWNDAQPLLRRIHSIFFLVVILALLILGILFWLVEYKKNQEHFPKHLLKGPFKGLMCATLITIGLEHEIEATPKVATSFGRVLSAICRKGSVIIYSWITAALTATLTVLALPQPVISDIHNFRDHTMATLPGTVGQDLVERLGGIPVDVPNVDAAFDKLEKQQVEAVVYHRTMLRYYLLHHPHTDIVILDKRFHPETFGFAFPKESYELAHEIDIKLVDLVQSKQVDKIVKQWLIPPT